MSRTLQTRIRAARQRLTPSESPLRPAVQMVVLGSILLVAGCESAYYSAAEKLGIHKRDILVDRVEEAMESQEEAKETFQSALEQFSAVVSIEPSELQSTYEELNDAFEDSEARAEEVSDRIDAVESVSEALFEEWREELEQYSSDSLRRSSERTLRKTQSRYNELMRSMRRAESRIEPVLDAFRDQVLFLKHNLNAQAIASLKSELANIETDVAALIRDMESSITRSKSFIQEMEQV